MTGVPGESVVPQLSITAGTLGAATSAIQSTVVDPDAGDQYVAALPVYE